MFGAMWNNFYNTFIRNVSPLLKGGIIFVLFTSALICLLFSIKGSKKDTWIKRWPLFIFAIIITALAVAYTILSS